MSEIIRKLTVNDGVHEASLNAALRGNKLAALISEGVAAPVNIPIRVITSEQELANIKEAHKRREEKLARQKL